MDYDKRLNELFIDLPEPPEPTAGTSRAVETGKLLYISGVLPFSEGKLFAKGKVGADVRLDTAKTAARVSAVNILALAKNQLGTLNKIKKIVDLRCHVAVSDDFSDHDKVADGASNLLFEVFGQAGAHTRSAVGCVSLPQNSCVELSVIIEVK